MHRPIILALLFLSVSIAGPATAQAPSHAESLLIGPGDLIHVQVYDTPQLEQHPRVDDAGNIPLLFVGNVSIAGDTPAEAAAAITAKMVSGGLMHRPQVSVAIEYFATQNVSVIGQVDKPGTYAIDTPRSIFEVLSMAGGLTALAERNVIVRRRGSQGVQQTFFVANTPDANVGADLKIYPGDTIVVPKVSFVYVLGDVARPGGYPITVNDTNKTVLEMLAEAGSANKSAVLGKAKLIRKTSGNYKVLPVDLSSLQKGISPDFALEADDVIFVPFSYTKNFLLNGSAIATSVAAAAIFIP